MGQQQQLSERDEIHTILSSSTSKITENKYDDRFLALKAEDYSSAVTIQNLSDSEKNTRQQIKNIEAQIQAAAKAVITSLGQENMIEGEVLMPRLSSKESYRSVDLVFNESKSYCNEVSRNIPTKSVDLGNEDHSENGTGDSSSQHDGAIDDDVFSYSHISKRNSWNSYQDFLNSDDTSKKFSLPNDTGEVVFDTTNMICPLSSGTSSIKDENFTKRASKRIFRSSFRTPSARAIQMSYPNVSSLPSSSSGHRNPPSVSQCGNPTSYVSLTKVTPSRLKSKKEDPLVLLHLTVMPLNYSYSCLMTSPELPESLKTIQESWRLLQDKLGDTVLERGVLLAHPQDSYETLEERLLDVLELPTYPRARILRCGHYMRSTSSESFRSGEDIDHRLTPVKLRQRLNVDRRFCDVCGREIRLQDLGKPERYERFRIKVYASNGLMSAGAWAAAWREMERVDVEIEPYVEAHLYSEFKEFASRSKHHTLMTEKNEEFEYEDEEIAVESSTNQDLERERGEELKMEAEIREYEKREEMRQRVAREEQEREEESRKINEKNNEIIKMEIEMEYTHELESDEKESAQSPKLETNLSQESKSSPSNCCNQDSFLELLIAAIKVVVRERRNLIIGIVAILGLLLVFIAQFHKTRPLLMGIDPFISNFRNSLIKDTSGGTTTSSLDVFTTTVIQEITVTQMIQTHPTMIIRNVNNAQQQQQQQPITITPPKLPEVFHTFKKTSPQEQQQKSPKDIIQVPFHSTFDDNKGDRVTTQSYELELESTQLKKNKI